MKAGHAVARHGVSFLTGERITFFEHVEPQLDRGRIIRAVLGWTAYPLTREARSHDRRVESG